jgi:hypothetical protein
MFSFCGDRYVRAERGWPAFFTVRIFLAALIENRKAAGAKPVTG